MAESSGFYPNAELFFFHLIERKYDSFFYYVIKPTNIVPFPVVYIEC